MSWDLLTRSRAAWLALTLAFVAALAGSVWHYGYLQALGPLAARGQSDLDLASDRLVTQLQRYREFAVLTARHPALEALHEGGSKAEAEAMLLGAADRTGAVSAFYMDASGELLASSGGPMPPDVPRSSYFRRALTGALGVAHGEGPGEAERVFFYAAPSFAASGEVRGVLVVIVDAAVLERDWRGSLPAVFFLDEEGTVFVTNRTELLGWRREGDGMVSPSGRRYDTEATYLDTYTILSQNWSPYIPARALRRTVDLPVIGMTGVLLIDVRPARRYALLQAAAVAAGVLFFVALLWFALERRRALAAINLELEARVTARTRDLEEANRALRREVVERQEAEAALKRAQAELVQASKLTALGKMSAGISHELNQPLMAIRSFAENGAAFLDRGKPERAAENLGRISDMAGRMGRIIKNLRAFAKAEPGPAHRIGLAAVVEQALELMQGRIEKAGATVDWQRPDRPAIVMGGEVRLSQVVVNLISNALDAMEGQEVRRLTLRMIHDDAAGMVRLTIRDTGPGIREPDRIFDPFYSTKEVGPEEGMGLGLSISYGIVEGFGGKLRGENLPGGGAQFTLDLRQAEQEVTQVEKSA
ncbi:ATP-binding protein [Alloyangia pacifica]|uniref:ATP-binding protein n=1 Tax=Alloyangia pacifica TaxID=311180 RepID=UPI001CFCBC9C|nr:ATP-binding protein [Alloyangia pacifica]